MMHREMFRDLSRKVIKSNGRPKRCRCGLVGTIGPPRLIFEGDLKLLAEMRFFSQSTAEPIGEAFDGREANGLDR